MHAVIIGASGLLGRSMVRAFSDMSVTGTGFNRTEGGLVSVNATSAHDIDHLLDHERPDIVINCVGERRPSVWSGTPERARKANVHAARLIAEGARRYDARLLHISSDYVFDGKTPPYRPDSTPNPLNPYGRWKLAAEQAVRSACPDAALLRLPVLYGPAHFAAETNVTEIARQVGAGTPVELDNQCVRYPTHADEAAETSRLLAETLLSGQRLASVAHWSAAEGFTKYQIALLIARRFGLTTGHIRAGDSDANAGDRPVNCRLDCQDLTTAFGSIRRRLFTAEFPALVEPWLQPAQTAPSYRKDTP